MLKDEGGQIDKESGNKVPVGGTKKGVRDDIPINISEGEFIFPEDVTRYIGLKELMNMRQEAKMGLKKMEAMGLMGNADEATIPDDLPFTMDDLIVVQVADKEGSEKDRADMKTGGLGSRSRLLSTPQVRPQPIVVEEGEKVVTDIMEAVEYRNAAGNSIIIMHYGGSPMYPIPAGYSRYDPETGELGEVVNPVTETVKEVNDVVTRASQSGKDRAPELPENEFTKAGSWENSPLDMYIKEAKKFSDGSSSIATSVMGIMGPSGFGLLTYGLVKLEKRKILNTIDDRIKNATGEQKQELIRIRDTLLGKIKGPTFVEKITNFVDGILAPEEVKTEIKNTAVKDINQPATVNNPEEVLPDELTIPPFNSAASQQIKFDPSQTIGDPAISGIQSSPIAEDAREQAIRDQATFSSIGPIEEIAARNVLMPTDTPVETGVPVENLVPLLARFLSQGQSFKTNLPEGIKRRYLDTDENGNLVFGQRGKDQLISDYGIDAVREAESQVLPQILDRTARLGMSGTYDPYFFDVPTAYPEVGQRDLSQISEAPNTRMQLASAYQTPSVVTTKDVQDRGFVPANIAQPAAIAETIAPTPTRADYDISQLPPVEQPSISQIDSSNIQTSGPPSVPDALRTPLGTAAAESAFEQKTTLPQPYDSSVDDLVRQTREALGTSDQSIEETIARAQQVINKSTVTEGTTSEPTFKPSASPIVNAAQSIAELGSTFVSPTQDQTEQAFTPTVTTANYAPPSVSTPVIPTPTVTTADYAPPSVYTPPTPTPTVTTADYAPPSVSAIGLGDPDIDFTTPTVTPKVEIDFDPSQTLGDPAISGMIPSTLTATPIVSSVSPTETGLSSFEQAFADARASGQDTFTFEGGTYTTKLASDTEPSVKAASDDKYDGAVVTGTKTTELFGGLKEGETKLKSEVEADNLANVIGVSRQEYDTMSEYEKSQALAGSSSAQEDRERKQAIEALETLVSKPRPPSGLGRDEAKRWLQENGYGSIDKKEAPDYIRKLQEDWDRENAKKKKASNTVDDAVKKAQAAAAEAKRIADEAAKKAEEEAAKKKAEEEREANKQFEPFVGPDFAGSVTPSAVYPGGNRRKGGLIAKPKANPPNKKKRSTKRRGLGTR